jgi:hypothetical protein
MRCKETMYWWEWDMVSSISRSKQLEIANVDAPLLSYVDTPCNPPSELHNLPASRHWHNI